MTALLREVIGDVLRRARISQGRTLREVSDRRASASGTSPRWNAAARKPPVSCSAPSVVPWTSRCRGC